ncbi:unnamed protein product [Penicillium camemberti]|uniref:Str. FM013 n=1 Tax=Penicillium camemberti (strain FM 013) TaxID=1429867 RepID=A0A0G4PTU4_PENC3|nr:unnamed protein product [Penicillium camemberti]
MLRVPSSLSVYLTNTWYPRDDLQKHNAVSCFVGCIPLGLGSLLAYGLTQMDGISGWWWIFIGRSCLSQRFHS